MGLKNWSLADIADFLTACGFVKLDNSASGSAISYSNGTHLVQLHYHGKSGIKGPDVMRNIIKLSGIPERLWTKEKRAHKAIKKDLKSFWEEVKILEKK